MSAATAQLRKLAEVKRYLFHGSPEKLETIEPRQAYNNSQTDGQPAVIATSYYEIAVFRAIMLAAKAKISNGQYKSGFSTENGKISFRASKNTLDVAKSNMIGFVYVLDKSGFQEHNSMEYRAFRTVKPTQIIKVSSDDLPRNIEIIS